MCLVDEVLHPLQIFNLRRTVFDAALRMVTSTTVTVRVWGGDDVGPWVTFSLAGYLNFLYKDGAANVGEDTWFLKTTLSGSGEANSWPHLEVCNDYPPNGCPRWVSRVRPC